MEVECKIDLGKYGIMKSLRSTLLVARKTKKFVKFLPEKSYLEKIELRLQRGRKLQKLSNNKRLKQISKLKKKTVSSIHKNGGRKKNKGSASHIRWHQGCIAEPKSPRSPGGILKHRIETSNSAPVLVKYEEATTSAICSGMRRNTQKDVTQAPSGMDGGGLLRWN